MSLAVLFLPLLTLWATVLQPHSEVDLKGSRGKLWATWAIMNLEKNKSRKIVTRMSEERYVDEENGFRMLRPCEKWMPLDGPINEQAVNNRSTVWSILRMSDSSLHSYFLSLFSRPSRMEAGHEFSHMIPSQLTGQPASSRGPSNAEPLKHYF